MMHWRVTLTTFFATQNKISIPLPWDCLYRRYLPACPVESPPLVIYQRPAETPTVSTCCKVIRCSSMPRIWHPALASISRLYKRLSIEVGASASLQGKIQNKEA